jgi:hypothetical protein
VDHVATFDSFSITGTCEDCQETKVLCRECRCCEDCCEGDEPDEEE